MNVVAFEGPRDPGASADPSGLGLLAARVAAAPALVESCLAVPLPDLGGLAGRRWVATGLGSSEAHARLLVHALRRRGVDAAFEPVAAFLGGPGEAPSASTAALGDTVLAVFSQGLSPNARVALDAGVRGGAAIRLLFTATTPAVARAAGKPERAAWLERWLAGGGIALPLAPAEEYGILVRVLGPLAGTVVALRTAQAVAPGAGDCPPAGAVVAATRRALASAPALDLASLRGGLGIIAPGDLAGLCGNLAAKFLEGLYLQQPPVWDWLTFVHGAFQRRCAHPHAVLVLDDGSADALRLGSLGASLLEGHGASATLRATLPSPWSLLEFECALDALVIRLAREAGLDQRSWPGKGLDGPIYAIER